MKKASKPYVSFSVLVTVNIIMHLNQGGISPQLHEQMVNIGASTPAMNGLANFVFIDTSPALSN